MVSIQSSHFYRPEPFLVFFVAASFWAMLKAVEHRRLRDSLLLGVFVGLTFAMKVSSLPLVLPLMMGYGFILATNKDGTWETPSQAKQTQVVVHIVSAAAVSVVVFFITTPYAYRLGELTDLCPGRFELPVPFGGRATRFAGQRSQRRVLHRPADGDDRRHIDPPLPGGVGLVISPPATCK